MGLFIEESVQAAFAGWGWFFWFWNVFYGSLHFIVTAAAMVYLYRRHPVRYRHYRTVLAITTGLALVGFAVFPLMPPRLLGAGGPYGADLTSYSFVDTLVEYGGLWSFDSGTMKAISNQWAAMPSLHLGWAIWCLVALYPVLTSRWLRIGIAAYPLLTLFAVVVTANHYWIDGVGGAIVLAAGLVGAGSLLRMVDGRKGRRRPSPPDDLNCRISP